MITGPGNKAEHADDVFVVARTILVNSLGIGVVAVQNRNGRNRREGVSRSVATRGQLAGGRWLRH